MWLNLRLHKHADRRSAWLGGLLQILWAATGVWLQICGHICEDKSASNSAVSSTGQPEVAGYVPAHACGQGTSLPGGQPQVWKVAISNMLATRQV